MQEGNLQNEITHLKKINNEQKMMIQILCEAYNSPDKENFDYNRIFNFITKSSLKMIYSLPKKDEMNQSINSEDIQRIKELEKQIFQIDEDNAKQEQQLKEYNAKAMQFEEQMAQNEREKAQILASFQRSSNSSNSNVSIISKN